MDAPLTKPLHLRPADPSRGWIAQRPAGAIAAALGLASFVVVAVAQPALWATPDPRLSVPGLAVTAVAAVATSAPIRCGWRGWASPRRRCCSAGS
jgi:hypothetical protein